LATAAPFFRFLRSTPWLICLCLFSVILSGSLLNEMPSWGLDPSARLAINYFALHGLQAGRDFVHPFGPLGYLYTHMFDPVHWRAELIFTSAIIVTMAIALWQMTAPQNRALLSLIIPAGALFLPSPDITIMAPPLLAAMLLYENRGRLNALIACLFILGGIAILTKFSAFLPTLAAAALSDAYCLTRRKIPFCVAVTLTSVIITCLIIGQDLSYLPAFIEGGLDIVGNYPRTMQSHARISEPIIFALLSLSFLPYLFFSARRAGSWREAAWLTLMFLMFFLVWFKAGFLRHDGHALTAWNGLFFACLTSFPLLAGLDGRALPTDNSNRLRAAAGLLVFGLAASAVFLSNVYWSGGTAMAPVAKGLFLDRPLGSLDVLGAMESGHLTADKTALYDQSLAEIRRQHPILPLTGTVDELTIDSAELVATNVDWRPRPVYESFLTLSPALVKLNSDYLAGDHAPDHLLISLLTTDAKYPFLEDGLALPAILQHYRPDAITHEFLYFTHLPKGQETPLTLQPLQTVQADAEDIVTLPEAPLLWATIHIEETLFGRLIAVFDKFPEIQIEATLQDGSTRAYRAASSMLDYGFMVSPLIDGNLRLLRLAMTGDAADAFGPWSRVKSLRILLHDRHHLFFKPQVTYQISAVQFHGADPAALPHDLTAKATPLLERDVWLAELMNGVRSCAVLEKRADHIFAHAPCTLSLMPPVHRPQLDLSFGMEDGSWNDGGHTSGACFIVAAEGQTAQPLFKRCLDPVHKTEDRGVQSASLTIPRALAGKTLLFITDTSVPGGLNNWGWSYWQNVVFK
jgi:hypothetical protein